MSVVKVIDKVTSLYLAHPKAVDFKAATISAQDLEDAVSEGLIWDISCGVEDGYTANMTDPNTTSVVTICMSGNAETPTDDNYEVSLDILWANPNSVSDAANTMRTATDLIKGDRIEYVLIKRISTEAPANAAQGDAFDTGQNLSFFGFRTDHPVPILADNDPIRTGLRVKPTGFVRVNEELVA